MFKHILKIAKYIFITFLFILVLSVILGSLLVWKIDPNIFKERIYETVEKKIGCKLNIEGNLNWSFYPWLNIETGPFKLICHENSTSQPLIETEHASVSIDLMPLIIKRKVFIDSMYIDSPNINIIKFKNGKTNLPSTYEDNNNKKDNRTGDKTTTISEKLIINKLTLNNANFSYTNKKTEKRILLSKINIKTGKIALDDEIPLNIDGLFNFGEPQEKIKATILARFKITENFKNIAVNIKEMTFNVQKGTFVKKELKIDSSSLINVDLDSEEINIPMFKFLFNNSILTGSLNGNNLFSKPEFKGNINWDNFDIRNFVDKYLQKQVALADMDALTNISLSGSVYTNLFDEKIVMHNILFNIDGIKFDGELSMSSWSSKNIQFALKGIDIDLNKYLPISNHNEQTESVNTNKTYSEINTAHKSGLKLIKKYLNKLHLKGEINIDKVDISGIKLDNVFLDIETRMTSLLLSHKFELFNGYSEGRINIDITEEYPYIEINEKLSHLTVNKLKKLIDNKHNAMIGNISNFLNIDDTTLLEFDSHSKLELVYKNKQILFDTIKLDITLEDKITPKKKWDLFYEGPAIIDMKNGNINLNNFNAGLNALKLSGSIKGSALHDKPMVAGLIFSQKFNLKNIISDFTKIKFHAINPESLSNVSFRNTFHFNSSNKTLTIDFLDTKIDNSLLNGQLSTTLDKNPNIEFNASVDKANLDMYIPKKNIEAKPKKNTQNNLDNKKENHLNSGNSFINKCNIIGRIKFKEAVLLNIDMNNPVVDMKILNNFMDVNIHSNVFNGKADITLKSDLGRKPFTLKTQQSYKNISPTSLVNFIKNDLKVDFLEWLDPSFYKASSITGLKLEGAMVFDKHGASLSPLDLDVNIIGIEKIGGIKEFEKGIKAHINSSIDIDLNNKIFTVSDLNSNLNSTKIEGLIKYNFSLPKPVITGKLLVSADINRLLNNLSSETPISQNESKDNLLTLETSFHADSNSENVSLSDIHLYGSNADITGNFSVTSWSEPKINFNINGDNLNIDTYITTHKNLRDNENTAGSTGMETTQRLVNHPGQTTLTKLIRKSMINGHIILKNLHAHNLTVSNLDISIAGDDGIIEMLPIFHMYGGKAEGTITIDASHTPTVVYIEDTVNNINVGDLIYNMAKKDIIRGKGNIKQKLSLKFNNYDKIIRGLNGYTEIKLTDGNFKGLNIVSIIRDIYSLVEKGTLYNIKSDNLDDFTSLNATFEAKNGILENDDLKMESPIFKLTGGGIIDLGSEYIDFNLYLKLFKPIYGNFDNKTSDNTTYNKIIFQEFMGEEIPIKYKGKLSDPDAHIDMRSIIKSSIKEKAVDEIMKELEPYKEKLKEKLFEIFN